MLEAIDLRGSYRRFREEIVARFRTIKSVLTASSSLMMMELMIQYAWITWILPFEIVNVVFGIASWYYYTKMFQGTSEVLAPYGGDPIAYIILGMLSYSFLTQAMETMRQSVMKLVMGQYSSGGYRLSFIEYLDLAGIPPIAYAVSSYLLAAIRYVVYASCYLVVGVLVFGVKLNPSANYGGAILALLLGALAMIGLGMISASMPSFIGPGVLYGVEPISWLIGLLSSVASGVYFPPEMLPEWLRAISMFLPQTYAIESVKLALLSGYSNDMLLNRLMILAACAVLLLLVGGLLIRRFFDRLRRGI